MSKKSREAIRSNLERAIAPPERSGKRSAHLDGLLDEYAPPEQAPVVQSTQLGIPPQTIPRGDIPIHNIPVDKPLVDVNNGYYPSFNDISDNLIPTLKLDAFEQTLLLRMYRLSRGWRRQECEVGYGGIVRQCNISRSKAQEAVASLIQRGLIRNLGKAKGNDGTRYLVLPDVPAIPPQGIPQEGIPEGGQTMVPQNIPEHTGIPQRGSNKHTSLNTSHTNTGDVGVRSHFSLKECRAYADSLRSEGIQNPGGYATKIHRTGEADELIEKFLNPIPLSPAVDASQCPDCQGSGWWYPKGTEKGIARCKHQRLGV